MWLLNTETRRLEFFLSEHVVPGGYAILSHTWGEDEMTFDEMLRDAVPNKTGIKKIEYACSQARADGLRYAWVDTVCIDKRSSAELSEAINSMFKWYRSAAICYVYLGDVVMAKPSVRMDMAELAAQFRKSRWTTRSWTLQELIAPANVKFYDFAWMLLGDKAQLEQILHEVTRIDPMVLRDSHKLQDMSVAKRMSWASYRSASRDEDKSYSLLGLFDVALPMLYGEGGEKAFRRLQEAIIQTSSTVDHSILAWVAWGVEDTDIGGDLSPSPYGFRHAHNITSWSSSRPDVFSHSNHGLQVNVLLSDRARAADGSIAPGHYSAALNCRYENEPRTRILLHLRPRIPLGNRETDITNYLFDRSYYGMMREKTDTFQSASSFTGYRERTLTVARTALTGAGGRSDSLNTACFVRVNLGRPFRITLSRPIEAWNEQDGILRFSGEAQHVSGASSQEVAITVQDIETLSVATIIVSLDLNEIRVLGRRHRPQVCIVDRAGDEATLPNTRSPDGFADNGLFWIHRQMEVRVDDHYTSITDSLFWNLDISRVRPCESISPKPGQELRRAENLSRVFRKAMSDHTLW